VKITSPFRWSGRSPLADGFVIRTEFIEVRTTGIISKIIEESMGKTETCDGSYNPTDLVMTQKF